MRGNQDARNALIYAFDELTNGAFSRHFTPAMPLFVDGGEPVYPSLFLVLHPIGYLLSQSYSLGIDVLVVDGYTGSPPST
jgi:hypothetical protein